MSGAVVVQTVPTLQGLKELEPAWNALLERCAYCDLYMTHRWITTWFHQFGRDGELFVLRFLRDGKDVGIAPLRRSRIRWRGLPLRQIGFPLNGCSQQGDLIVPEDREQVFRAFARHLEEEAGSWDVVHLDGISDESGSLPALMAALEGSSVRATRPITWESLVLRIDGTWEEFLAGRPRWLRKNLRVGARRLERLGQVTRRCYTLPEEMDQAFSVLLDLEPRSWKYRAGEAISLEKGYVEFFRESARVFAPQGAFQVRTIEIDGQAIAGNLVVLHNGTVHGIKTWYDERFAEASPGRAVFHYMAQDLWDSGVREIHLDRRTAFYEQWTSETRSYHTVSLYNRRLYSRLLRWLKERRGKLRRSSREPEES